MKDFDKLRTRLRQFGDGDWCGNTPVWECCGLA